jgi:hypothetical protein
MAFWSKPGLAVRRSERALNVHSKKIAFLNVGRGIFRPDLLD